MSLSFVGSVRSCTKRAAVIAVGLCAVFASGGAVAETISYVGADGGDWDTATNWDPETVPTASDDVTINGKWVKSVGSITVKSILVKGANGYLTVAGTTKTLDRQTGADPSSTEKAVLTVTGDLVLNGGQLSLGGRRQTRGFTASVGGNLVITNGAKAFFYAGATSGLDPLLEHASAKLLFENANVVAVGGELRVSKSSYLYPENERLTGTPVFFKTSDFTLEQGGTISATARGWRKYKLSSFAVDNAPVRAVSGASYAGSNNDLNWYTYSFQSGTAYWIGNGHGGDSSKRDTIWVRQITAADGTYKSISRKAGYAYGYETAPFLSGAAAGVWNEEQVYAGGGSICIFASGKAVVDGTLVSDGETGGSTYNSSAGGSIWLAAARFSVGRTASFATTGANSAYGTNGAGGRIALTAGATAAELASFDTVTNMCAYGYICTNLYGCVATAYGGYVGGSRYGNGTVKLVYKQATSVPVEITATPEEAGTVSPAYGLSVLDRSAMPKFDGGSEAAYDAFYHNQRRTSMSSYVLTDLAGNQVTTPIAQATDCLRLTWQSTIEALVRVRVLGGGTVRVNGTDCTSARDLWIAEGDDVSFSATAGTGAFVRWIGDFAGAESGEMSLSLTAKPGMIVYAVFSDASEGGTKSFVGADGGFWDVDANWSPSGVPTPFDDATIASKKVRASGVAAAKSLTLSSATLSIGGATTGTTAMNAPTDYAVVTPGLWIGTTLSATGASALSIGARRLRAALCGFTVGGDCTLAGSTTFTAYAPPYDGVLVGGKIPLTNAYDTAFAVTVGGHLTVADTAVVYPECDIITGNGVRFEVTSNVTIGASASFNATKRGWGWFNWKTDILGDDSRKRTTEGDFITCSIGYGQDYTYGGAFGGGRGSAPKQSYGSPYAPCLSGSPSGAYGSTGTRGAGLVWVEAGGTLSLDGKIYANGGKDVINTGTASSGGGIWLASKKIMCGASAALQAIGGDGSGNGGESGGTGGRIALALGVTKEDLRTLAKGECPSSLSYSDGITACAASVAGGYNTTDGSTGKSVYAAAGTTATVVGEVDEYDFTVVSTPANLIADGVAYETVKVQKGATVVRTAPERAYDPTRPADVRYSFAGWVVSNATDEVAAGDARTASFVANAGPFTLTWIWRNRETRATYAPNNAEWGEVRVNGAAESSVDHWSAEAAEVTLVPVPKSGCEFLFWTGEVPLGYATTNAFKASAASPLRVMPVFRRIEAARTRYWAAGTAAAGTWTDYTKWDPADNLPGAADTVVISNGYCLVSNRLVCANLVVSNAAIVRVAQFTTAANKAVAVTSDSVSTYARSHALGSADVVVSGDLSLYGTAQLGMGARRGKFPCNISVGGDLTLNGASKLHLVGGLVDGVTTTHAKGGSRVDVGGTLAVRDTAAVYPESEYWAGGSPVFRVGKLIVEAGASFDADSHGYDRGLTADGLSPLVKAPGAGQNHSVGGSYGGLGGGASSGALYGFANSPVLPGSCKGDYRNGESGNDAFRGGGLIRIHVGGKATILGKLTARGTRGDTGSAYGSGASGGGIWVTAANFVFGENAGMSVCGRDIGGSYGSQGGGGRIALGWGLSERQIDAMSRSADLPRPIKAERVYDYDGFAALWTDQARGFVPSVDLQPGKGAGTRPTDPKYYGTFRFVDGRPRGLMLLVK